MSKPDCRENATLGCASVVVTRHNGTEPVRKGQRLENLAALRARLRAARGKAVKVISFLIKDLPDENDYRVLFMRLQAWRRR